MCVCVCVDCKVVLLFVEISLFFEGGSEDGSSGATRTWTKGTALQ